MQGVGIFWKGKGPILYSLGYLFSFNNIWFILFLIIPNIIKRKERVNDAAGPTNPVLFT